MELNKLVVFYVSSSRKCRGQVGGKWGGGGGLAKRFYKDLKLLYGNSTINLAKLVLVIYYM